MVNNPYGNNYPDIILLNNNGNPTVTSVNTDESIAFALNKEGSYDLEEYRKFLDSGINLFRHSPTYKHYKAYLYSLGMNCCQFHPRIQSTEDDEIDLLEMHHCMINIYDIAILITEHTLNTNGYITEFDLAELLKFEHINNRIPIVFLCKTCHQLYHHKYLYVHPNMCFGKWWELIERYNKGLNRDITFKLMMYLKKAIGDKYEIEKEKNLKLLELRDSLYDWSKVQGVKLSEVDGESIYKEREY